MVIHKTKNHQKLVFVLGVLVFLLGLSTVLASSRTLFSSEARLLIDVNSWPASLKVLMLLITYLGSEFMLLLMVFLLVQKGLKKLALRLVLLAGATYAMTWVIKHAVARPRPILLISKLVVRQSESGYGFPSGHVAITTLMAITLCRLLPRSYRWQLATLWIVLVALSRLYLGVHAPLDIVGGFALGGIMALVPDFLQAYYDKPTQKSVAHK